MTSHVYQDTANSKYYAVLAMKNKSGGKAWDSAATFAAAQGRGKLVEIVSTKVQIAVEAAAVNLWK